MYSAIVRQLPVTDIVHAIIEKHKHVHTWYRDGQILKCIYMYVHGTYMVCTFLGINMYVHRSDIYVTVHDTNIPLNLKTMIDAYAGGPVEDSPDMKQSLRGCALQ